jgi:hypothetical protein
MIVKGAGIIGLSLFITIYSTAISTAYTDTGSTMDRAKVIGIVPLPKAGVNQDVYRYIDRIVPELKKLPSERIVKLECSYNGLPEQGHDILSAYKIAGRIEKYLREHHKLNLDLWIAAYIDMQARKHPPALTFSVFSDDITKLDKMPLVPTVSTAE